MGAARTVYVNGIAEAAHLDCARPALFLAAKPILRSQLKLGDPDFVPVLSPDYQCVRCGNVYERGDRFVQVYRAEGPALDQDKVPSLKCSEGYETAHLDCKDPKCAGTGALIIGLS